MRICYGEIKKDQNAARQLRLVLGALVHKDPREIIPLPGDYDYLRAKTQAEINELLRKWGKTEWIQSN